jgi:hypothetical protein
MGIAGRRDRAAYCGINVNMRPARLVHVAGFATLAAALLVACGGGGGNSQVIPVGPTPVPVAGGGSATVPPGFSSVPTPYVPASPSTAPTGTVTPTPVSGLPNPSPAAT